MELNTIQGPWGVWGKKSLHNQDGAGPRSRNSLEQVIHAFGGGRGGYSPFLYLACLPSIHYNPFIQLLLSTPLLPFFPPSSSLTCQAVQGTRVLEWSYSFFLVSFIFL